MVVRGLRRSSGFCQPLEGTARSNHTEGIVSVTFNPSDKESKPQLKARHSKRLSTEVWFLRDAEISVRVLLRKDHPRYPPLPAYLLGLSVTFIINKLHVFVQKPALEHLFQNCCNTTSLFSKWQSGACHTSVREDRFPQFDQLPPAFVERVHGADDFKSHSAMKVILLKLDFEWRPEQPGTLRHPLDTRRGIRRIRFEIDASDAWRRCRPAGNAKRLTCGVPQCPALQDSGKGSLPLREPKVHSPEDQANSGTPRHSTGCSFTELKTFALSFWLGPGRG